MKVWSDEESGWTVLLFGFIIYGKKHGEHRFYFSERNGYIKSVKIGSWQIFAKTFKSRDK